MSVINRNMIADPAMITFIMLFSRKAFNESAKELLVSSPPLGTVPDYVPPGVVLLVGVGSTGLVSFAGVGGGGGGGEGSFD